MISIFAAYWTAELVGRRNRGADARKRRVDRVVEATVRLEKAYTSYRMDGDTKETTHELNAAIRLLDQSVAVCGDRWVADRAKSLKDGLRLYYLMFGQPYDPLNDEGMQPPGLGELRQRNEALGKALRTYEDG
ncbi:hypothetical protein [Gordonia araii]|uniref:hypothetical protein n=1 Tax=Gordonia araii TaxID=263909 RepID=UPI0011108E6E|nr:hypothetical protein [Gordonia araii]NNG97263.1 hypothetical protein [Gordonia araii NBRC 100433]